MPEQAARVGAGSLSYDTPGYLTKDFSVCFGGGIPAGCSLHCGNSTDGQISSGFARLRRIFRPALLDFGSFEAHSLGYGVGRLGVRKRWSDWKLHQRPGSDFGLDARLFLRQVHERLVLLNFTEPASAQPPINTLSLVGSVLSSVESSTFTLGRDDGKSVVAERCGRDMWSARTPPSTRRAVVSGASLDSSKGAPVQKARMHPALHQPALRRSPSVAPSHQESLHPNSFPPRMTSTTRMDLVAGVPLEPDLVIPRLPTRPAG